MVIGEKYLKKVQTISQLKIPATQQVLFITIHWGMGINKPTRSVQSDRTTQGHLITLHQKGKK